MSKDKDAPPDNLIYLHGKVREAPAPAADPEDILAADYTWDLAALLNKYINTYPHHKPEAFLAATMAAVRNWSEETGTDPELLWAAARRASERAKKLRREEERAKEEEAKNGGK